MLIATVSMRAQIPAHNGMAMAKPAASTSATLTLTGLGGITRSLTPDTLEALPHVTVTVMNAHNGRTEVYSGVPVKDLLDTVASPKSDTAPKVSANMTLIVAEATDHFRVAITLCDTDPTCRNGQAIVADSIDGKSLAADGAFNLVLTEDKKPGRWARNLASLNVQAVR